MISVSNLSWPSKIKIINNLAVGTTRKQRQQPKLKQQLTKQQRAEQEKEQIPSNYI
jgi:hypothetical protein